MQQFYDNTGDWQFSTIEEIKAFYRLEPPEKIEITRKGITRRQLDQFREATGLSYSLIASMIGISAGVIYQTKKDAEYSPLISDHLASIFDLFGFGYIHFKDPDLFNDWMRTGFSDSDFPPPATLCDTSFGREEVIYEILRLKRVGR